MLDVARSGKTPFYAILFEPSKGRFCQNRYEPAVAASEFRDAPPKPAPISTKVMDSSTSIILTRSEMKAASPPRARKIPRPRSPGHKEIGLGRLVYVVGSFDYPGPRRGPRGARVAAVPPRPSILRCLLKDSRLKTSPARGMSAHREFFPTTKLSTSGYSILCFYQ